MCSNKKSTVLKLLNREDPGHIINAPNYWQWFAHHKNHKKLPKDLNHCRNQLDMINALDLTVLSRNIYCNEQECWFGGLLEDRFDGVDYAVEKKLDQNDLVIKKKYKTKKGVLTEQLRYIFRESTLVQQKFLSDDSAKNLDILEEILKSRRYNFLQNVYVTQTSTIKDNGVVMAGDVYSPLKMLYMVLGPVETVYLLSDDEPRAMALMALHETSQLDAIRQMAQAGVPVIMAMDNLDTQFHPPYYVEKYCASFYTKASKICHEHGSNFFIHACGNQKANLKLISDLGVDGMEGVAFPPIGDVELDEVMEETHDRFIVTGGITAVQVLDLNTRNAVFKFTKELFTRMRPFRNRFVFSASCNTPINTDWETIINFRDAWKEYAGI